MDDKSDLDKKSFVELLGKSNISAVEGESV